MKIGIYGCLFGIILCVMITLRSYIGGAELWESFVAGYIAGIFGLLAGSE